MKLGFVLRCVCIASGVAVGTAVAIARTRRKRTAYDRLPERAVEPAALRTARRDYFAISKARGSSTSRPWILEGFGRYECLLFFPSWREAMDQACFRTDTLALPELVPVSSIR